MLPYCVQNIQESTVLKDELRIHVQDINLKRHNRKSSDLDHHALMMWHWDIDQTFTILAFFFFPVITLKPLIVKVSKHFSSWSNAMFCWENLNPGTPMDFSLTPTETLLQANPSLIAIQYSNTTSLTSSSPQNDSTEPCKNGLGRAKKHVKEPEVFTWHLNSPDTNLMGSDSVRWKQA